MQDEADKLFGDDAPIDDAPGTGATMTGEEPTILEEPTVVSDSDSGRNVSAAQHVFQQFSANKAGVQSVQNDLDMILDIPVQLTVELGRTRIPIKNILQLAQGSVVELEGLAGEPMDVLVNGCLIAQGEVVVVNDRFGIRLTDIVTPSERLRRLNK